MPVNLIYDERMELHKNETGPHVEQPARLSAVFSALQASGVAARCDRVPARAATEGELLALHGREYVDVIKATARAPQRECEAVARRYRHDVFVNGATWDAARLAAGSAIELTARAVAAGRTDAAGRADAAGAGVAPPAAAPSAHAHGLAVIRPPGHHACAHCAMGFSFFNSVALAAKLATGGGLRDAATGAALAPVERVLVIDWDVHHGNGTEALFLDDPSVLYFSVHRGFESRRVSPLRYYPGTGAATDVGGARARGRTVNLPWSEAGATDADYAQAWASVLAPIARAFAPELVLVSAGFDAAAGDPLGECECTPAGYFALLRATLALGVPHVLCLEGGYNLDVTGDCCAACVAALLGDDAPPAGARAQTSARAAGVTCASARARRDINACIEAQRPYWPSLEPLDGAAEPEGPPLEPTDALADALGGVSFEQPDEGTRPRTEGSRQGFCPMC